MTPDLLQDLTMWQQDASHDRAVTITIGKPYDKQHLSVWAYDYDLMTGEFITTTTQLAALDLKQLKKDRLLKELETC